MKKSELRNIIREEIIKEMSNDTMDFIASLILDILDQQGYLKKKDDKAQQSIIKVLRKV